MRTIPTVEITPIVSGDADGENEFVETPIINDGEESSPGSEDGDSLARTGVSVMLQLVLGVGLILIGGFLLLIRHRRAAS
jgi:LPXTG-motif cell wall-anchored protein